MPEQQGLRATRGPRSKRNQVKALCDRSLELRLATKCRSLQLYFTGPAIKKHM